MSCCGLRRRAEELVESGLGVDVERTGFVRSLAEFVDAPLVVLVDLARAWDGSSHQRARIRARPVEHAIDRGLYRFGDLRPAILGRQAGEPQVHPGLDALMLLLEPLEYADRRRAIGREGGGAVPGHNSDEILRQQPLAHEVQHPVGASADALQAAAAENDQEHPAILRADGIGHCRRLQQLGSGFGRRRRLRRQRRR